MRTRVLYILERYPQLSETYIKTEIEAVRDDYEIRVVSLNLANLPARNHHPYEHVTQGERLREIIEEFRPHVMHTHYFKNIPLLSTIATSMSLPYTVRAHSFDVLGPSRVPVDEYCLGILTFPFSRPTLEGLGIPPAKIIDCYPVVNYNRFYDTTPNEDGMLNLGACLPKKRFEDFIQLGCLMPGKRFNLYSIGYSSEALRRHNETLGSPVTIHEAVQPEEMAAIYKQHTWLVYTACPKLRTVGWPMAVAEVQAAGVGVCLPNMRPDLAELLGGAGVLFDSIEELPAILARPYPAEMRIRGFEQARKSDIAVHKSKLTALWDSCASRA